MYVREFAEAVLVAETLDEKLRPPPEPLDDDDRAGPTPALARPSNLAIRVGGDVRVPPASSWHDAAQRVRILHALANHELQAAELFAWALLAFPDAPSAMRRGWLRILADEQRHCRMYIERLAAHGAAFGDFPVSGHFWRKAKDFATPLDFVCAMGLTFENANLDFGSEYVAAARRFGDEESARKIEAVHVDEIHHVRFAWDWLNQLKPASQSAWDAYCSHMTPPHGPRRARGATFDRASRVAAGFDEDFIARLESVTAEAPGGAERR